LSKVWSITYRDKLFEKSAVTPACRANDTSDVFVVRGGKYLEIPAKPFRSASLDHIQCGHVACTDDERSRGTNLGLYSVTLNNRLEDDLRTLEAYQTFRIEAEAKGFRHFLEVFNPNAPHELNSAEIPAFINDHIARTLAGVAYAGRPVFLKIVYQGPKAMQELVSYDPHLVVGILGGSAGTTYDAFKLVSEAQKYGARAALFGRKINQAESQLAFVEFLRLILDGKISPEEAVKAYHGVLQHLRIKPRRSLAEDMELQTAVMSYGGSATVSLPVDVAKQVAGHANADKNAHHDCGCGGPVKSACSCESKPDTAALSTDKPDFSKMSAAEKLAWNKARRDQIFG